MADSSATSWTRGKQRMRKRIGAVLLTVCLLLGLLPTTALADDTSGHTYEEFLSMLNGGGNQILLTIGPNFVWPTEPIELTINPNIDHLQIMQKLNEIASRLSKDDIVRLIIKGKHKEENPVQKDLIIQNFYDKFFNFEIVDETQTDFDFEKYSKDVLSLKGEFLRSVFESKELSDREKEKIATLGLEALKGEDLSI